MSVALPPHSQTRLMFDFERGFLRYSEFPTDPERGREVPAAILLVADAYGNKRRPCLYSFYFNRELTARDAVTLGENTIRMYTATLGIMMPSPDFSMPYNVISISSTIFAIAFSTLLKLGIRPIAPAAPPGATPPSRLAVWRAKLFGAAHSSG